MTGRSGRGLSLVAAAVVLVTSLAAPVAGGGGTSTTITNAVGGSFVQQGPAGLFAAECGEVGVELVPDPLPVPWIWLTAFEFPLASLPSGATVASATLSLRDADGASADTFHISGYAGDGAATAADMVPAGASVTYVANGTGYQVHDVTALITPAMPASGWAGFLVRPDTTDFDTVHHSLDCLDDGQFPTLTITFGLPDAAMAPPDVGGNALSLLGLVLCLFSLGLLTWRRELGRRQ